MTEGIPHYDELKLRLDTGTEGHYRILAVGPDGSTASGTFTKPFNELELGLFVMKLRPRRHVRAYRSSQMEEAKRFGTRLFKELLSSDVGKVYLGARRVADAHDRGLRVTLYLTDVPELMEIPWEFLYDEDEGGFLSQSIYTPVVRSLDLKSSRPPPRLTLPLRILGLVSSPQGFHDLDVGQERRKLEQALAPLLSGGLVELDWLERATLAALDRTIGAPDEVHVIHYIGHGAYDERTQGGILVFENAHGGPLEVTGEELCSLVQDERSLRLVVLNSCEGARSSHVDPFSGVASSLVRCGVPAVIGMQVEITDEAAITFADRLYTALAQGFPADAGLAQARRAIFAAGSDIEFGTPVLFLRAADARLFEVQPPQVRDTPSTAAARPGSEAPAVPAPREASARLLASLRTWVSHRRQAILVGAGALLLAAALALAVIGPASNGPDAAAGTVVEVGKSPEFLAIGEGAVWVGNNGADSVTRVDPHSHKVIGEPITVGSSPRGVAVGAGAVWVAVQGDNAVTRIDPPLAGSSDRVVVETIPVGDHPDGVAVGAGSVWVTNLFDRTVTRIDVNTRRVEGKPIGVGTSPGGILVSEGLVWVANYQDGTVMRIDPQTNAVVGDPIQVGEGAGSIAEGAGALWVSSEMEGTLSRIKPDSKPPSVESIGVGERPLGVAVTAGVVWVANAGDDSLTRVDPESLRVIGEPIPVGDGPFGLAADRGALWVVNSGDNTVQRLEPKPRRDS